MSSDKVRLWVKKLSIMDKQAWVLFRAFSKSLICQQPPKQLWDSRWFFSLTSPRPDQTNCVAYKKCVFSCLIIHFDVCLNVFTRHSGIHVAYGAPDFYKKRKQPQPQQQQQQKQHKYLEELIVDLF